MPAIKFIAPLAFALPLLSACATTSAPNPQDQFWQELSSHCGKAFAGRLTSDQEADAAMRGKEMMMHVRECRHDRIAIPFHVRQVDGRWDRSRTWIITRTRGRLRLKHDHRHMDGTPDSLTNYGGDTANAGTTGALDFPVDRDSIALFRREGRTASFTNIWRIEVDATRFTYQLTRQPPNDRLFRVEFDLTTPVATPPAPWGMSKVGPLSLVSLLEL